MAATQQFTSGFEDCLSKGNKAGNESTALQEVIN
jgi:hypothetical protein